MCASKDTLDRFIQYQLASSKEITEAKTLNNSSFTVVSADNIDFLHSYARVNQQKKGNSWHGTSIQAVQPRPSMSTAEMDIDIGIHGCSSTTVGPTISRKRIERQSPLPSPMKQTSSPKAKRRMRTGTENTRDEVPSYCSDPTQTPLAPPPGSGLNPAPLAPPPGSGLNPAPLAPPPGSGINPAPLAHSPGSGINLAPLAHPPGSGLNLPPLAPPPSSGLNPAPLAPPPGSGLNLAPLAHSPGSGITCPHWRPLLALVLTRPHWRPLLALVLTRPHWRTLLALVLTRPH